MKASILSSVSFLPLFLLLRSADAFVIAPPWVNGVSNPCSSQSWQLIYWPKTKKCYPIFEQGPCPRSQELAFDALTKVATCRCPKDLLYWTATDRCYPEFTKGPCEANQYLEKDPKSSSVQCTDVKRCDNGWVFWPSLKECFELYTQGPCHKGDLLIMNPLTAEPYCGCDPLLLRQYYFPPLNLCYEHFTRGPCEAGLLFAYNHTSESTHCACSPLMVNHHAATQQCFQFGTKGPCSNGQVFVEDDKGGKCSCRSNYVLWSATGDCHKSFTPGPCGGNGNNSDVIFEEDEQFIVPEESGSAVGKCVRNPCPGAHLYFPDGEGDSVQCHKVGSRGPCQLGQLVVFEKYSGKSYRGECGCSPGYNQNYWPATGQCYEWFTPGPCEAPLLFQYNRLTGRTDCLCDADEVFWNETGRCYKAFAQGPCPDHSWLIPGEEDREVFCECRSGYVFDPAEYKCMRVEKPQSLPPPLALPLINRGDAESAWLAEGVFVSSPPGHTGVVKRQEVKAVEWAPKAMPRIARRRWRS